MKVVDLINEDFTPIEAKDILLEMFNKNINFNKIRNFSSQVRYGVDDEEALKRIEVLKHSVESINQILKEARQNGKVLKIRSTIEIDYVD